MKIDKAKVFHLIYPHQLHGEVFSRPKGSHFILIEDPLFFGDKIYPRKFHKQKLVLHRASMKALEDELRRRGRAVSYLEYARYPDPKYLAGFLKEKGASAVTVFDPTDDILLKRLNKHLGSSSWDFSVLETPGFLTPFSELKNFFGKKKRFLMSQFYIFQRQRLGILVDRHGRPAGGRWSYDTENRKRLPKGFRIPPERKFKTGPFTAEAIRYVDKFFPENPGHALEFNYPISHPEARELLKDFLTTKLKHFGEYEDAISEGSSSLFHSKLSAPLNIGLISPREVVEKALEVSGSVPLASLEGFLRQIIGWREFMRAVYLIKGSEVRAGNALKHRAKISTKIYEGKTGILPLDQTIRKVIEGAYCHHIERLMILGNFMLLAKIDPDEVYGWFMDMFIDAYDWVMVPNVYCMSQFADGGTITTKPYFSSSNYILKMSDYPRGEWCLVWDALFYRFLDDHREIIGKNPRLKMLLGHLDRLESHERLEMKKIIKKYF